MANIRFSQLPEDLSPSSTDVVPIEGATTRKVTIANLVAAAPAVAAKATKSANGSDFPSPAAVRANIGAASSIDVAGKQPLATALTALAGLTTAANKGLYYTGADMPATFDLSAAGRALIDDADIVAQRNTLGLGDAATRPVGTTTGTVAAGNDTRIVGAAQRSAPNAFSDLQTFSQDGASGKLLIVPGSSTYTAYANWYRPDGTTRLGYLGYATDRIAAYADPGFFWDYQGTNPLRVNGVAVATINDIAAGGQDKGAWNASTNSPALTSTSPAGPVQKYTVSTAGTSSGPTGTSRAYNVGDQLFSTNGSAWSVVPFTVSPGSVDTASLSTTVQNTINGKASASSPLFVLQGGAEGGEIRLEKPASGTTIAGDIVVDLSGDDLRIWENGGTFRGAKLPIGGLTGGIGTTFLFSNSQYTPPWTGAKPSISILSTLFTKDKFATWNIDPTGATDASTNVQRALQASVDEGYTWQLPGALIRLDSTVSIIGRGRLKGTSPQRQTNTPSATNGTWFKRNHTGILFDCSSGTSPRDGSSIFESVGVCRTHPAPSGGTFTPSPDDYDFKFVQNEAALRDVAFLGVE